MIASSSAWRVLTSVALSRTTLKRKLDRGRCRRNCWRSPSPPGRWPAPRSAGSPGRSPRRSSPRRRRPHSRGPPPVKAAAAATLPARALGEGQVGQRPARRRRHPGHRQRRRRRHRAARDVARGHPAGQRGPVVRRHRHVARPGRAGDGRAVAAPCRLVVGAGWPLQVPASTLTAVPILPLPVELRRGHHRRCHRPHAEPGSSTEAAAARVARGHRHRRRRDQRRGRQARPARSRRRSPPRPRRPHSASRPR